MYENFFHIISRYIQVFSISSDSMEAIIDCSQNRTVNTTFFYNTYLMILSEFSNHKILNGPKVKNDVLKENQIRRIILREINLRILQRNGFLQLRE